MSFDIDIDLDPSFDPLVLFPNWVRASVVKNEVLGPHPCGIYPQDIAVDPITKLAAIPYDQAEELGYFKLDFLHLTIYQHFTERTEMLQLLDLEPDWSILLNEAEVEKLFQLSRHAKLLKQLQPTSIEELADALALIRPGKQELLPLYLSNRDVCRGILYLKDTNGFSFKKSHAIAYAHIIVLQLHLIGIEVL
jgi:DNA polymerase III alpha subunit